MIASRGIRSYMAGKETETSDPTPALSPGPSVP
jgi:hypothetical protein